MFPSSARRANARAFALPTIICACLLLRCLCTFKALCGAQVRFTKPRLLEEAWVVLGHVPTQLLSNHCPTRCPQAAGDRMQWTSVRHRRLWESARVAHLRRMGIFTGRLVPSAALGGGTHPSPWPSSSSSGRGAHGCAVGVSHLARQSATAAWPNWRASSSGVWPHLQHRRRCTRWRSAPQILLGELQHLK